jgi:predicted nucleotidyltransferase
LQDEQDIERIVRYFSERDEVVSLYLFGSSARGRKTKECDIDIAVLINESGSGK